MKTICFAPPDYTEAREQQNSHGANHGSQGADDGSNAKSKGAHRTNVPGKVEKQPPYWANVLRNEFGIKTPDNFPKQLFQAHLEHYSVERNLRLSREILTAIVDACLEWEEHLKNPDMLHLLVCNQVLCFVRIHCAVISLREIYKIEGIDLLDTAPSDYTTVIDRNGLVSYCKNPS